MSPLVVVTCGKTKSAVPTVAGELYRGTYARAAMRWAESVVPRSRILILSAKYGLLRYHDIVAPYDLRLGQPGSVTADVLRAQAEKLGILQEKDVVVVAGADYLALLTKVWPHARKRFSGGMLSQVKTMREQAGKL